LEKGKCDSPAKLAGEGNVLEKSFRAGAVHWSSRFKGDPEATLVEHWEISQGGGRDFNLGPMPARVLAAQKRR